MQIEIPSRFAGPPAMGHGGYVAGLLATRTDGPVQVTLRRPTPLDTPLELVTLDGDRLELRQGEDLITESEPMPLSIDVPRPPSVEEARAAEDGSPSHYGDNGVHPICFGCGKQAEGDALRVYAGPLEVDGQAQVAGVWRPGEPFAEADGTVDTHWVLASLDCPGAFAFIVNDLRAGLLGRIQFEQYGEVRADAEHVVTGWQIGVDGRKLFAGTAIFDAAGTPLAAARATWFQRPA